MPPMMQYGPPRSLLHRLAYARRRLFLGCGAIVLLLIGLQQFYAAQYQANDFEIFRSATQRWLNGGDPYGIDPPLAPGAPPGSNFAYPFPALYVLLPFAWLTPVWAMALHNLISIAAVALLPFAWAGASSATLRLGLLGLGYFPLIAALEQGQWSPLLLGIAGLTLWLLRSGALCWSGFMLPLVLVKPQIGGLIYLALLLLLWSRLDWRWWTGHLAGWFGWWGSSLALDPLWPQRWLYQLELFAATGRYQSAVAAPVLPFIAVAGVVLLSALLALLLLALWRGDRLLAGALLIAGGIQLVPFAGFYDPLVIWLALVLLSVRCPRSVVAATLLSWLCIIVGRLGGSADLALLLGLFLPVALLCGQCSISGSSE